MYIYQPLKVDTMNELPVEDNHHFPFENLSNTRLLDATASDLSWPAIHAKSDSYSPCLPVHDYTNQHQLDWKQFIH